MKKRLNQKILKNKSGDQLTIGLMIIGVVIILVISFFLYQYYVKVKDRLEVQNCKNSITAHAMLATDSKYEVFTDIKCPTKYMTINTNDFTKAKNQIAEDMAKCWYEWGKGQGQYFKESGYFCHVCSVYDFKPKGVIIPGFIKYLATEPASLDFAGGNIKGVSYQDYIQGYSSPNSSELIKNPKSIPLAGFDMINTSNKYSTIFFYISGKDEIQEYLQSKKAGFTIVSGTAVVLGTAAVVGGGTVALGAIFSGAAATAAVNIWNPVGWVIGGALVVAGGGFLIYDMWFKQKEPVYISQITFVPYTSEQLKNIGCEKSDVVQLSNSAP